MRLQPPGPLRARRLRDEPPDLRLPELSFTRSAHLGSARGSLQPGPGKQLPAATPARWTGPTPAQPSRIVALPRLCGETRVQEQLCIGGGRPTGPERVSGSFWNDSVTPLVGAPASGGAHSCRQTPGWPCVPSVLHHNSNSTLSIKVSKSAPAPPPTHPQPRAAVRIGLCPRGPPPLRQRWRPLGTSRQLDADPGRAPRSLPNTDNPRVPGPPFEASSP